MYVSSICCVLNPESDFLIMLVSPNPAIANLDILAYYRVAAGFEQTIQLLLSDTVLYTGCSRGHCAQANVSTTTRFSVENRHLCCRISFLCNFC